MMGGEFDQSTAVYENAIIKSLFCTLKLIIFLHLLIYECVGVCVGGVHTCNGV